MYRSTTSHGHVSSQAFPQLYPEWSLGDHLGILPYFWECYHSHKACALRNQLKGGRLACMAFVTFVAEPRHCRVLPGNKCIAQLSGAGVSAARTMPAAMRQRFKPSQMKCRSQYIYNQSKPGPRRGAGGHGKMRAKRMRLPLHRGKKCETGGACTQGD